MTRVINVMIAGDSESLQRSFKKAGDSSETFGKRMGVSMKTLAKGGAVGAAVGGMALVTKQLFASVAAAKESEAAQVRLEGAFKSAGVSQAAMAKVQARISKVSKTAALDDEDLSDSMAKLTRTSGSAAKGLKGMQLAADIARARNISLGDATKIVEKAMTGQFRGLKANGVEIGKNTTVTQALERANKKFAGSAEAFGKTAAGSQAKLGDAFENLQEKIGTKLLPIIAKLSLKLVELIEWSEKNWPRISRAIQQVVAVARPYINALMQNFRGIANVIAGVVKTVKAIKDGEWSQVWAGMKQIVVAGVGNMVKAVLAIPKRIVAALGKAAFKGLEQIGSHIGEAIERGLKAALQKALNVVQWFIDRLKPVSGVLGKIGIDVKLPKVNGALEGKSPARRGTNPGGVKSVPRDGGMQTRRLSVASAGSGGGGGLTINGGLTLQGIQNPTQFLREMQRIAATGATPRRGRYGGANLGTG